MSTLDSWLQNKPVAGKEIDGKQLYQKTLNKLNIKGTADGALVGGVLAMGFIGFMGVGGFAMIVLVALLGGSDLAGCIAIIPIIIIVAVIFFFIHQSKTGKSRAVLSDPAKAAEAMRAQVGDLGARGITDRERERLVAQVQRVHGAGGGQLKAPDAWLVYDNPTHSSFTLGRNIFLTRELIYSDHLGGLLAHELGRLQNGDGLLRLAVQQLLGYSNKAEFPYQEEWVEYWRQQVYKADEFAAKYGFGRELIDYLEMYQPLDVAKAYLWQEEPYKAERIDRLEHYLERQTKA